MKTKSIYILGLVALMFSACSDNFLNRQPDGDTMLEETYQSLDDALEGTVRGMWSKFYAYGGEHDEFGVRAIDMYTDIWSGDMAMAKSNYGWFETDERGLTRAYRGGYLWSFYYNIIRSCNKGINAVEAEGGIKLDEIDSEIEYINGYYYAQLLAVRGWCYANLIKYFSEPSAAIDVDNTLAIPVYDENFTRVDTLLGAERSTVSDVYTRATEDLMTAIRFLEKTQNVVGRESKYELDDDAARVILAYAYLNWGGAEHLDLALSNAKKVIDNGRYNILPHSQLFSTGFADIKSTNWLWGEDVTTDNSTALASFFGQVDIHSYSYAWAGDTKSIDERLYNEIVGMGWDDRANWFRTIGSFKFVPDRKFFSPGYENTTDANKIDHDWLPDIVWLRMETAYLIAAEASLYCSAPDLNAAAGYLDAIMSERVKEGEEANYQTYLATLASEEDILQSLIYNWRVELWGEGYSLQTLRRLEGTRQLGNNHLSRGGQTLNASTGIFDFEIPTSEVRYNPYITDRMDAEQLTVKSGF